MSLRQFPVFRTFYRYNQVHQSGNLCTGFFDAGFAKVYRYKDTPYVTGQMSMLIRMLWFIKGEINTYTFNLLVQVFVKIAKLLEIVHVNKKTMGLLIRILPI